jgi:hypothetical protein
MVYRGAKHVGGASENNKLLFIVTYAVNWINIVITQNLLLKPNRKSLLINFLNNHTSKEQVEKVHKHCPSSLQSSVCPYSQPDSGYTENAGVIQNTE